MKRPHLKLSRPHITLPRPQHLRARIKTWLKHEEVYEKETFLSGIANIDSLADAIAHGVGELVMAILRGLGRAATWPFRTAARLVRRGLSKLRAGLRQAGHEFKVVVGEILSDLRHLLANIGRSILSGLRRLTTPFIKSAAVVTAPVRRRFANQAKAQALSEVTMTADTHAHWEALALVAAAIVAVGGLLIATGQTAVLSDLTGGANQIWGRLDLGELVNWFASASPSALAMSAAIVVLLGLATLFWIRMTIDAWKRDYPTHLERTRWRTITALFFIPGAIVYFAKVYNHWGLRQFLSYHAAAVLMVGTAVLVATSTYGTLWYFNKQADAAIQAAASSDLPNLELDQQTRQSALDRPQYGAPLQPAIGGKTDPFAPVPGQGVAAPGPGASPAPSPSPSASPRP